MTEIEFLTDRNISHLTTVGSEEILLTDLLREFYQRKCILDCDLKKTDQDELPKKNGFLSLFFKLKKMMKFR